MIVVENKKEGMLLEVLGIFPRLKSKRTALMLRGSCHSAVGYGREYPFSRTFRYLEQDGTTFEIVCLKKGWTVSKRGQERKELKKEERC